MKIKLNIDLNTFYIVQLTIVTLIVILGLSSYIFSYMTGHNSLLGFLRLLDVGSEQSIPTYFSLLNIFLSSILIFIIYWYEKVNNHKGFKYWLFLSILFLLLSIDEGASIHEIFGKVHIYLIEHGLAPALLGTANWLPFGVLFVLIVGIILLPFFKLLSRDTLYYFLFSGSVFIIGAIGFEFAGTVMVATGFVDSKTDLIYLIRRIFEEGFEMYGIAIFNYALYREIVKRKISLTINSSSL